MFPSHDRVCIVGDHPWSGHAGDVVSLPNGKFEVTRVLGGEEMLKVTLDDGHKCFAGKQNLRLLETTTGATDK